ncbi:MAG: hypothetical protein U0531_18655 [Dehalococcoidia bacterium]
MSPACATWAIDQLPGYHALDDALHRAALEAAWGVRLPAGAGMTFPRWRRPAGRLKALLVVGDNPLLTAPDKAGARRVGGARPPGRDRQRDDRHGGIGGDIVLPDVDVYGKEGTYTPADRRYRAATPPPLRATPAPPSPPWPTLASLSSARGAAAPFAADAEAVMAETRRSYRCTARTATTRCAAPRAPAAV